jgi:hypothetical protein
MEHRTQFEIDGLQRAKGVLNAAETFVGAHCRGGIGVFGRQIGADHIDAVERGRPIAAPICATRLTEDRRSSRAISESWSVVGIANGGNAPSSA